MATGSLRPRRRNRHVLQLLSIKTVPSLGRGPGIHLPSILASRCLLELSARHRIGAAGGDSRWTSPHSPKRCRFRWRPIRSNWRPRSRIPTPLVRVRGSQNCAAYRIYLGCWDLGNIANRQSRRVEPSMAGRVRTDGSCDFLRHSFFSNLVFSCVEVAGQVKVVNGLHWPEK